MVSKDYRDYVIKDGNLVGEFDKMYQNSKDVPWHQDKTAFTLFTEIDLSIIKFYNKKYKFKNVCEIGCGYGYITSRLKNEILSESTIVNGFDISQTVINKAKILFPKVNFMTVNIIDDNLIKFNEYYDFLYIKDILWYVVEQIDVFKDNLNKILTKNGCVYIMNSIPDLDSFYGQTRFPNAFSIIDYFSEYFDVLYASSTYEIDKNRVFGNYNNDKYVRLMLKKKENNE